MHRIRISGITAVFTVRDVGPERYGKVLVTFLNYAQHWYRTVDISRLPDRIA